MVKFEPKNSEYRTISILGHCCNDIGVVHLAQHSPSGQMVAVKRFNMDKAKEESALIEYEIILTKQLRHSNILKYLVSYVWGSDVCVVSPLMGYGSCRDLLNNHFADGLPENAIALILRDVLDGVDYIHKKGLIHRAIRASHVLISDKGHACITGFRYACGIVSNGKWQQKIHSYPSSTVRNLNWLSPEVLQQNLRGYNERSDIYSVGVLICELANGAEPYADMSTTVMLTEKVRGSIPQLLDCSTIHLDDHNIQGDSAVMTILSRQAKRKFNEGLHEITLLCMQYEEMDRPTAAQLLTHPYLKFNRKHAHLTEYLAPVIPLSDKVAYNKDELDTIESVRKMSDLELYSCDWDF
nr:STE20-related kinase adapter protein alpha [Onthophagus taurus]